MNEGLKACVNCEVTCQLRDNSKSMISRFAGGKPATDAEIRAAVSKIALIAVQNGCPSSEIGIVKQETLALIRPRLTARQGIVIAPHAPHDAVTEYLTNKNKTDRNRL